MHYILFILLILFTGCTAVTTDTNSTDNTNTTTNTVVTKPTELKSDLKVMNPEDSGRMGGNLVNEELWFATSQDETNWEIGTAATVPTASVSDLIQLDQVVGEYPAGTLLSYFVDASEFVELGDERIALVASTDGGKTWTERKKIEITNLPGDMITVDPSIVQLDDGQLRLYFYDFGDREGVVNEAAADIDSVFYSALSDDGENFTLEGEVFRRKVVTDPEVAYFNGQWFMYLAAFSVQGIAIATSDDGLNFTDTGVVLDMPGIPGSMVVDDELVIYGCNLGMTRATSKDGLTFSDAEVIFQTPGCDPDPVQLDDGTFALMFKQFTK